MIQPHSQFFAGLVIPLGTPATTAGQAADQASERCKTSNPKWDKKREDFMSDEKHQPGPDPRAAVAGEHTILEGPEKHPPVPSVGSPRLGYALPARADGNIYARPITVTSVESTRQLVTGHVFIQPDDKEPVGAAKLGNCHFLITDAKMGNPSEPGTCHWLRYDYMGRSDGPGLTPVGSTEVTQDVSEGNTAPLTAPAAGTEYAPADTDKDGTVTPREQKRHDKGK